KGVLSTEDARAAARVGADAVVVSNHGGRQLDGVPSTISVLPRIAEGVAGQTKVLLDGGVRSGLDVFRARALGAEGVLIGRPWAYAVAASGQAGVAGLLGTLRREMEVAMALCGVTSLADITPGLVTVAD
ncbi:MAG: alpha-hydroxy-acid oxidizing protein, partial [Rhodobacteraceae bacterium]|nr:alpha-hydroxy-acid oxidizing protein [Paracoccaceae bacterium]